ncbi:hypothetical protein SISNIDRAFT_460448, partial [Sistotremastrum niveocremeum HHB9708]
MFPIVRKHCLSFPETLTPQQEPDYNDLLYFKAFFQILSLVPDPVAASPQSVFAVPCPYHRRNGPFTTV